jgi:hypothetical protein
VLPRRGSPLREAIELSAHAVERFAVRGRALHAPGVNAADRLHDLIEQRGVARVRAPTWFQGKSTYGGFFVSLDGSYLLLTEPVALRDGVLPSRPFIATTFIAMQLADADLAEMTSEELSLTVALPPQILDAWETALAIRGAEPEELRAVIADRGRATREQPIWLRTRRSDMDRFFVRIEEDIILVVGRGRRSGGRGARFRATALFDAFGVHYLQGEALAHAVRLEGRALSDYRNRAPGVPDGARDHLRARITAEGRLAAQLPEWAGPVTWHGPVLLVGEDVVLTLRPVSASDFDAGIRWSAWHCFARTRPETSAARASVRCPPEPQTPT